MQAQCTKLALGFQMTHIIVVVVVVVVVIHVAWLGERVKESVGGLY
jgi:hypothetical protein